MTARRTSGMAWALFRLVFDGAAACLLIAMAASLVFVSVAVAIAWRLLVTFLTQLWAVVQAMGTGFC